MIWMAVLVHSLSTLTYSSLTGGEKNDESGRKEKCGFVYSYSYILFTEEEEKNIHVGPRIVVRLTAM
jgi:hypothetical protein